MLLGQTCSVLVVVRRFCQFLPGEMLQLSVVLVRVDWMWVQLSGDVVVVWARHFCHVLLCEVLRLPEELEQVDWRWCKPS